MTYKQLRKMILAIITAADYDLAKSFGRGAEDPALAKQTMQAMIGIARKHVEAIEAAARAEGAREERGQCATAIEDKRHEWEEAAQVAGDRRDWDGTDNYEAMAEAAARLEGIIRSRAAKGGEK